MMIQRTILFFLFFSNASFGQSQQLTQNEARQDFEFFIKTIETKHPDPGAHFPNYKNYKDSLLAAFPETLDKEDFAQALSLYTNLFRDGHTFALNKSIPETAELLPFDVKINATGVYVENLFNPSLDKKYIGGKIISINQQSIESILKAAMPYLGGETEAHKMARLENGFPNFVYRVVGEVHELDLQWEGKTISLNPDPVSRKRWLAESINNNRPVYEYKSIDPKTSLITFTDMSNLSKREFKRFLEATFKEIKDQRVENLIIDLRHNGGGNFIYGQMLLSYLTNQPYKIHEKYQYDREGLKVNKEMINEIKPSKQKNLFSGKVYYLVGPYTYSSAATIIAAVKANQLGQIIGKPIGQPFSGFIDMTTFQLPNSNLLCGTSTAYYEYIGVNEDNSHKGIPPDIETEDDALEFVLKQLE